MYLLATKYAKKKLWNTIKKFYQPKQSNNCPIQTASMSFHQQVVSRNDGQNKSQRKSITTNNPTHFNPDCERSVMWIEKVFVIEVI